MFFVVLCTIFFFLSVRATRIFSVGAPTLTGDFSTGRSEKRSGLIRWALGISLGIYPGATRDIAWDLSGGHLGNRLGFFRLPLRRSPSIFGIALGVSEHVPRHFPFKIPGDLDIRSDGETCVVPSNHPCFEHEMVQDEALNKCGLLLFEDPALEAQPRHEVAVGVGRNEPMAHNTVEPSTRFSGVYRFEDPVGAMAIVPNRGGFSHQLWYVFYCDVVFFYAIPLRWGIVTCFCCCFCLLGL